MASRSTRRPGTSMRWRSTRPRALALVAALGATACTSAGPYDVADRVTPAAEPQEPSPAADWTIDEGAFGAGFLEYPSRWTEPDPEFGAGFSMYVAAWPFQQTYHGPFEYQTGLPSTWLYPAASDGVVDAEYSTIEGGLGWWQEQRFATETPKFVMGGVAAGFSEWANGPGAGAGTADVNRRDWDVPQGKYGVAQLSQYVLWAPDGLNLAPDTNGELFGYGYHPLPIIDEQPVTAGQPVATGERSWTLFLSTAEFHGPVSFFIPNFFSKPALVDPAVEGAYFDSSPTEPSRAVSMETQYIPSVVAAGPDGATFARIAPTQFPATDEVSSVILDSVVSYSDVALAAPMRDWFDGGVAPQTAFRPDGARRHEFDAIDDADGSTYTFVYEGLAEEDERPIDWDLLVDIDVSDPGTFRYRWNLDVVDRVGESFVLPSYYRLTDTVTGQLWRPIDPEEVPVSTGLVEHSFVDAVEESDREPYVTPDEPDSLWQSPGPASGPFEAVLGDNSVVTYAWYRFVDQPAIRYWDFPDERLDQIQSRVEQIHRVWDRRSPTLAPPSTGELASLDPGILVEPPVGLEIGYVPIVTRQESVGS
ncbi:MAG: hypothetical protein AB8G26_10585 [Ilumatobacter sp.]